MRWCEIILLDLKSNELVEHWTCWLITVGKKKHRLTGDDGSVPFKCSWNSTHNSWTSPKWNAALAKIPMRYLFYVCATSCFTIQTWFMMTLWCKKGGLIWKCWYILQHIRVGLQLIDIFMVNYHQMIKSFCLQNVRQHCLTHYLNQTWHSSKVLVFNQSNGSKSPKRYWLF